MTMLELVTRDYKRAKIAYLKAKERKNVAADEVEHLAELLKLRFAILEAVEDHVADNA